MQRPILAAVSALALAALACSVNLNLPNVRNIETGPEQVFTISEPAPASADVVEVSLGMGAGRLTLDSGASGLLEGEIRYNVAEWKPELTTSGGTVTLRQPNIEGANLGLIDDEVVNDWTLTLGDVPLRLEVEAGAYEGNLNLGGVPLQRLEVRDGASSSQVSFDELNPETMDRLVYETGASSVTLTGLANANFDEMEFKGGAGDYNLDFSGDLQRDATVEIVVGLCDLNISAPTGTRVRVEVTGGLNDVNTQGTWSANNNVYETTGSGPLLSIEVDMGAGSLTLVSQ